MSAASIAGASLLAAESSHRKPGEIDFTKQVQPILAKRCYACHGPDEAESGLRFIDKESAFAEADSGEFAIVAGDVEASMLIARITSEDEFERMPPEGDPRLAQGSRNPASMDRTGCSLGQALGVRTDETNGTAPGRRSALE